MNNAYAILSITARLDLEHDPAEEIGGVRGTARAKHDDGNASAATALESTHDSTKHPKSAKHVC